MNTGRFRLVYSQYLGMFVPAAETAKACGKKSTGKRIGKQLLLPLLFTGSVLANSDTAHAAPVPLPATALPTNGVIGSGAGTINVNSAANAMTVTQSTNKMIVNWGTFNIGSAASVNFSQPGSTSAALNRVTGTDVSQIYGNLSANGQVYLINQNGIVFGSGAKVNVNSLVASSLNVTDALFNQGITSQTSGAASFIGTSGFVQVDPGATLTAASGGKIMMFAPTVSNSGVINTPDGQTLLAAGQKIYLASSGEPNMRGLLVEVDGSSTDSMTNTNLGQIVAERGNITLAGFAVNQNGRVTATTSVTANGSIKLQARNTVDPLTVPRQATVGGTVTLGPNSTTEVLPDYSDKATVLDSQTVQDSFVDVSGASIHLMNNAWIVAPGGNVSLYAGLVPNNPTIISSGYMLPNASRIYFESGSGIDVSGVGSGSTTADRAGEQAASVSVASNIVSAQLRGTELADSPLQRNGILYKSTVYVDSRKTGVNGDVGTSVANVSGYTSQIGHTVSEHLAKGGAVSIQSEGDVIFNSGANIDVSGGKVNYTGDAVTVTKLVASNGQVYDIANAPKDLNYITIKNVNRQEAGYTEGKNAGSVSFVAPGMVLNGSLKGNVTAGIYQRAANKLPAGASLQIGQQYTNSNVLHSDIVFDANSTSTNAPSFSDAMSADQLSVLHLGSNFYAASGFRNLSYNADGQITVQQGSNIQVQPGGSISLNGSGIDVQGNIVAHGGNISLAAALTSTSYGAKYGTHGTTNVHISGNSTLDTSGLWTNDVLDPLGRSVVATSGGAISVSAATHRGLAGANVILDSGSLLNASGGAWLDNTGKLTGGNGGAIKLAASGGYGDSDLHAGGLTLDGSLRADALATGGSLSLTSGSVTIGSTALGTHGETLLSPALFRNGGFTSYAIQGYEGVTLADNTKIAPVALTRILDRGYALKASGSDMAGFSHLALLPATGPAPTRNPTSLSLTASTQKAGTLTLGQGSAITTDPGASVSLAAARQLTVLGSISAPAGKIAMTLGSQPSLSDAIPYLDNQTLWLGSGSVLDVSGIANVYTNARGLRVGTVMDAGSITLDAQKGTVVAENGAVLNLNGTHAVLDLRGQNSGYRATDVASKGGSLSISALEGVLFDATMNAHGGAASVAAGSFALSLYSYLVPDPLNGNLGYPTGDREIKLEASGSAVPTGLKVGDSVGSTNSGMAHVFADKLTSAGFDNISLTSPNRILLSGNVALSTRSSITLDTPNLLLDSGAHASLTSGYVGVGNSSKLYQGSDRVYVPATGSGTLNVSAKYIDLFGNLDLGGASQATFASQGDLQLRGELTSDTTNVDPAGSLKTAGDLTFSAARIYPSTLSSYTINSSGSNATVTFARNGNDTGVPYSVMGALHVKADNIVQGGVLRAPFGVIDLAANKQLTLQDGSLTSVSAEGKTLPFGTTVNGTSWIYDFGGRTKTISTLPDKAVKLNGDTVNIAAGSKVDISGGGDLQAWEFTPGTGGSSDVLAASGVFAIIPGLGVNYMPGNSQSYNDTTVKPGDMVYLSGGNGLAAGYYMLLPAHYALLNGAYTVKVVAGKQDMAASQNTTYVDGSALMSGYLLQSGGTTADARTAGFLVASGSIARTQSEFTDTRGGNFFSTAYSNNGLTGYRLPADAGRLSMSAISNLSLDGTMLMTHDNSARGAEVDISSSNIAISGDGSTVSGYLNLDSGKLNAMGAESLLIGGTRSSVSAGTQLNVNASNVKLIGNASLSGQEIMLAATGLVSLGSGTAISGSGKAAQQGDSLIIGDSTVAGSGEGALLRVASGAQRDLVRYGVNSTPAKGALDVQSGASVAATGSIILDATYSNQLNGNVHLADGGALRIGAPAINIGSPASAVAGLLLDNSKLAALGNPGNLQLKSYSTINFYGNAALGTGNLQSLTLESAGLAGYENAGGTVTLHAKTVEFSNPDNAAYSPSGIVGSGTLSVNADDQIIIGANTFQTSGFGKVALTAGNQVIGQGAGELNVTGDLSLTAGRITVAGRANQVIAASGKLTTSYQTPAQTLSDAALGGQLTLRADTITHDGVIDMPAGTVTLQATGASGGDTLILGSGSVIRDNGVARKLGAAVALADGGTVNLKTVNGNIRMDSGAIMDVSATGGAAAGTINVDSAGSTSLGGTLSGGAAVGNGVAQPTQGSFSMKTAALADFSALNGKLETGSFNQQRDIRVKSGDINVASTDTITAHEVTLTADDGNLTVAGKINAFGSKGGKVTLNAGQVAGDGKGVLTLASTATIDASATPAATESAGSTGNGGKVILNVVSDRDTSDASGSSINAVAGSVINVSGAGKGRDGTVILRAPRTGISNNTLAGNGIAVTAFGTTVLGNQASIVAEGVKVYKSAGDLTMDSTFISSMGGDNASFLGTNTIASNLGLASDSRFSVASGDEVRSTGSITVTGDMDVHTWGLGALSLRAAKDINVNANISAGFTTADNTGNLTSGGAWSYRMAAGADLSSAGMLETNSNGTGNFTLGSGNRIRTGTGDIDIAAGGNFALTDATSVIYTAGTPDATDYSSYGKFTNPKAAIYPVNGGDVSIHVGGNIAGAVTNQLPTDWLYRQGYLSSDGASYSYVIGAGRRVLVVHENPSWWPVFGNFQENIGTLGGGDVDITAGGNINQLSAVIATNGRVFGTGPADAKLVVNGGGDLTVRAAGDIVGGLYMDDKGKAVIRSGGSLLADGSGNNAMFALGDAKLDVESIGDLGVMTVFNPTLTGIASANKAAEKVSYFSTYGTDSSVTLTSVAGGVNVTNKTSKIQSSSDLDPTSWAGGDDSSLRLYPGTLRVSALGGNIEIDKSMAMLPATNGDLQLAASQSLYFVPSIGFSLNMSDLDLASIPSVLLPASPNSLPSFTDLVGKYIMNSFNEGAVFHSATSVHQNDVNPVVLYAGVDIVGSSQYVAALLPKKASVYAGRDIKNLTLVGQNLNNSDVTTITAGRDLYYTPTYNPDGTYGYSYSGITWSGPGYLDVAAGRNINLSNAYGIVTRGNLLNPYLPDTGASLSVLAGASGSDDAAFIAKYLDPAVSTVYSDSMTSFVESLTGQSGLTTAATWTAFQGLSADEKHQLVQQSFFNELKQNAIDNAGAATKSYDRGHAAIATLFPSSGSYGGNLDLSFSQVKTERGGNLNVLVPGGQILVGLPKTPQQLLAAKENNPANASASSLLGIFTVKGGDISTYSSGSVGVAQSRVFTVAGGDILMWSNNGDVDAGKGSKTATSAPPPLVRTDTNGNTVVDLSGVVTGSGIGTLQTVAGAPPGNVYLIAPTGTINAGDAGVRSSGKIIADAAHVANADNFQAAGGTSGVPHGDSGTPSFNIGGLTDTAASAAKSGDSLARQQAANSTLGNNNSFMPSFITVEVIGFGNSGGGSATPENGNSGGDDDTKAERKRRG